MKPHYARIRKVKTGSGATAVQVGFYRGKSFQLTRHIGSGKYPEKIEELVQVAQEYVRSHNPQLSLNFNPQSDEILFKRGMVVTDRTLAEAREYLEGVYCKIGFSRLDNTLLEHFAMIRVLEPASKIQSLVLLKKYFGISWGKTTAFRGLEQVVDLKTKAEAIAVSYARKHLNFDFSLVFYDVTTLYFETHIQDEFRRNGFSKDNKSQQPQILIALVVNRDGFPLCYDMFKGNTFEGKTFLPTVLAIKRIYHIDTLTVVADAGMLSDDNIGELETQGISYIVGARLGTLSQAALADIAQALDKTDGRIVQKDSVLYEYSARRATKDRADNDRALEKARYYLTHPGKVLKRSPLLSTSGKKKFRLNQALIDKYRFREGIKGYRTNLTALPPELVVARYRDLWKIEQSFRIAKSDLEARPIFHRKETSIKYHILIVFIALCMARVIEMETRESVKQVMDRLKDKWTLTIKDDISGNTLKLTLDAIPH